MYCLKSAEAINRTPWEIPFERRIRALLHAHQNGFKVCALLYELADTSTFRYRAYNFFQSTSQSEDQGNWRCIFFFGDELDRLMEYTRYLSLATVIRMKWTKSLDRFVKRLKVAGIPVLFDTDDLVFDLEYLPEVMNTLNVNEDEADFDSWFAYIGRLGHSASLADGFTTTNDLLGRKLQEKFNKPFEVIPNYLNNEQLAVSGFYRKHKHQRNKKSPFAIGYFSGSPTHYNDFKMVSAEVCALLAKHKDIRLKVVGFMEFPDEMEEFIRCGQVELVPLVDFITLQQLIAEVEVNIVPLVPAMFTHCKSELKFFEAAIVNTVTVASPAYSFEKVIAQEETGFLCKQGEWFDTLEAIYKEEINVATINSTALDYVFDKYREPTISARINDSYNKLTELFSGV